MVTAWPFLTILEQERIPTTPDNQNIHSLTLIYSILRDYFFQSEDTRQLLYQPVIWVKGIDSFETH